MCNRDSQLWLVTPIRLKKKKKKIHRFGINKRIKIAKIRIWVDVGLSVFLMFSCQIEGSLIKLTYLIIGLMIYSREVNGTSLLPSRFPYSFVETTWTSLNKFPRSLDILNSMVLSSHIVPLIYFSETHLIIFV